MTAISPTGPVWTWEDWPHDTLVLIGCGAKKITSATSTAAEYLYTGSLFLSALAAAHALTERRLIRIVSARHGFVPMGMMMHGYDTTWKSKNAITPEKLAAQVRYLPDHSCVVSLMPGEYTRRVRAVLPNDVPFVAAMEDIRGIGDMRHRLYLISQLEDASPRTEGGRE